MNRTIITTDCVCDLPEEYLDVYGIDVAYFYILTDTGRFRDGYVLTSENILEYLAEGGKTADTIAPAPEMYRDFFQARLRDGDALVHISASSKTSLAYRNASEARTLMGARGEQVTVVDSRHMSTGLGHIVMRAVQLRDQGKSAAEIAEAVEAMRNQVSTTFIARDADYLHHSGRMSKGVRKLCAIFLLHPVLSLVDGKIVLKTLRMGNYEKAVMRYVRSELRRGDRVDPQRLFITHAGCSVKLLSQIREEVRKIGTFREVVVTKASATVSSNCGPGSVGVIYVHD